MSADANADALALPGATPVTDPVAPATPDAIVAADTVPAREAGTAGERPMAASGATLEDGSLAAPSVASASAASTASAALAASAAPAEAPAKPARRRFRTIALVTGRRLLRLVLTLSLFGAGVSIGWQSFVDNRPVTEVVGDPAVVGNPAPAIVAELANAIAADDADAIRAALTPEIFSSYTADLQNFGIATVEGVDTLGTYVDDNRTATVLVIHGRDAERNPFSVNLVVITEDGQIVRLR